MFFFDSSECRLIELIPIIVFICFFEWRWCIRTSFYRREWWGGGRGRGRGKGAEWFTEHRHKEHISSDKKEIEHISIRGWRRTSIVSWQKYVSLLTLAVTGCLFFSKWFDLNIVLLVFRWWSLHCTIFHHIFCYYITLNNSDIAKFCNICFGVPISSST